MFVGENGSNGDGIIIEREGAVCVLDPSITEGVILLGFLVVGPTENISFLL